MKAGLPQIVCLSVLGAAACCQLGSWCPAMFQGLGGRFWFEVGFSIGRSRAKQRKGNCGAWLHERRQKSAQTSRPCSAARSNSCKSSALKFFAA